MFRYKKTISLYSTDKTRDRSESIKRLLLASMFQNVAKILKTLESNLKNKTITYIPTASKVEKLGFFVRIGKYRLKRLGFIVEELEISSASYETITNTLTKNDYIYVTGGNTFFLLQELKRTRTDKILIQEIRNGKLYIGESAGAIVVALNIEYYTMMDDKEKAPNLSNYSGLGVIDFYPAPHFKNWEICKYYY